MGILLMAISRRHEEKPKAASVARPTVPIDFATHFLYGDEGITQAVPIVPGFATLTEAFFSANQSTFRGRNVR